MSKVIALSEVKARLSEIMKEVSETRDVITITKAGSPAGVLLSADEYESLIETLEVLSDPELTAALKQAEKEAGKGKFLSHEEIWSEL
jgi:prevent-host-death family protein